MVREIIKGIAICHQGTDNEAELLSNATLKTLQRVHAHIDL